MEKRYLDTVHECWRLFGVSVLGDQFEGRDPRYGFQKIEKTAGTD